MATDRTSREAHEHGRAERCRTDRVPASADGGFWFLRGFMAGAGIDRQVTLGARPRLESRHELGLLLIRQVIDESEELVARGHGQGTGLCRAVAVGYTVIVDNVETSRGSDSSDGPHHHGRAREIKLGGTVVNASRERPSADGRGQDG